MKYKTEGDIQTAINILGRFCGKRDISAQVREANPLFASKETNETGGLCSLLEY